MQRDSAEVLVGHEGMNRMSELQVSTIPCVDWPAVIREVISVRTSAYLDWNGEKAEVEQAAEAEAWLKHWKSRRDATLFAARRRGRLLGYLTADERERGEYYISHIGVHSDAKREGIGRALVRRCIEEAVSRGYRAVCTTTYNRYRGMLLLLIQEGFCIQGTTWVEGAKEPRISLRKELKTYECPTRQ